jgi:NAD(P)-dependent dehydrogenase (short-subunit alcohol dehydrogenase family)
VKQLFAEVAHEFGGLDVLVNNAGVYSFGPLESVTETEFHRQYNTNVLGTLLATQEAVKLFGEKGGSIINIGTAGTQKQCSGRCPITSSTLIRFAGADAEVGTADSSAASLVALAASAAFRLVTSRVSHRRFPLME